MSDARFRVDEVEVYSDRPFGGHRVRVVRDAAGLDAGLLARIAAALGGPTTVFILPVRRDDCAARLRVFTPGRELPLSIEAAVAAAVALGFTDRVAFEQSVVATEVSPSELEGRPAWCVALDRPVVGSVSIDDRESVAEALGLPVDALDPAFPIRAANTGVLTLPVALRDLDALAAARLNPVAWASVVEKAKVVFALPFVAGPEGTVRSRCLSLSTGLAEHPATGVGAAAVVSVVLRHSEREGTARWAVTFSGAHGREATVTIARRGDGSRDGDTLVVGTARHAGEGTARG